MVDIVPISATRHAGKAWRRPTSFAFVATQAVVPLVAAEFSRAAIALPIGFIAQEDAYVPVAVMSPVAGRNLAIGPGGQWLGGYVPANLRSYPFRLGQGAGDEQLVLCVDEDSGMIVESDGVAEDLVDPEGKPTPAANTMLAFLLTMEQSRRNTAQAIAVLAAAGLIQPWQFQVMIDGQATSSAGIYRVDEAALNALDDAAFATLRRTGALALAYMQLVSMNQIALFDQWALVRQQLVMGQQQQPQITSLDEIFARAANETLQFN